VRELSHVIERAVLWSQSDALEAEQLSLSNMDAASARVSAGVTSTGITAGAGNGGAHADTGADYGTPIAPPGALPPRGTDLAQWEKSMIEQALREANGNQTQAAQRLGVSRDTLRYRLKKFGIQ
ncbi:MAG TPA: helix-turn-helix domain-containing protein, partial [Gemmatimonadaceae bacterium]|nr:helix-turn-helix domain-containing protein [Gemmatimonadaceae bacterium]